MPPKPKFTRDEIIAAALELVSARGEQALTARELGKQLGSSARPLFTVFKSMEEVQTEVRAAAMRRFESYAQHTMPQLPLFKQVGMQMILFATQEPKLFQLLFMQETEESTGFDGIFARLGPVAESCVELLCQVHSLTQEQARTLFENVWIYTFGIGALCATKACSFTVDQLSGMLSLEFSALLQAVQQPQQMEREDG